MTRNGTETRQGQDRETGLGAKHDGPVAAGDAPITSRGNTIHATSPELLPCPFCGATLEPTYDQVADFRHPRNGCFLGGVGMVAGPPVGNYQSVTAWNTRQPQSLNTSPVSDAMIEAGVSALKMERNACPTDESIVRKVYLAMKAVEQSSDLSPDARDALAYAYDNGFRWPERFGINRAALSAIKGQLSTVDEVELLHNLADDILDQDHGGISDWDDGYAGGLGKAAEIIRERALSIRNGDGG